MRMDAAPPVPYWCHHARPTGAHWCPFGLAIRMDRSGINGLAHGAAVGCHLRTRAGTRIRPGAGARDPHGGNRARFGYRNPLGKVCWKFRGGPTWSPLANHYVPKWSPRAYHWGGYPPAQSGSGWIPSRAVVDPEVTYRAPSGHYWLPYRVTYRVSSPSLRGTGFIPPNPVDNSGNLKRIKALPLEKLVHSAGSD
jgi:hypothetical protein